MDMDMDMDMEMEIDTVAPGTGVTDGNAPTAAELTTAVRAAQAELSALVEALTTVLQIVADSEPEKPPDNRTGAYAGQQQDSSRMDRLRHKSQSSSHAHQSQPTPQSQPLPPQSEALSQTRPQTQPPQPPHSQPQSQTQPQAAPQPPQPPQQPSQPPQQQQQQQPQQQQQQDSSKPSSSSPPQGENGQQQASTSPSKTQKEEGAARATASLTPILIRLTKLRAAVQSAVRLHAASSAQAQQQEDDVSAQERATLTARHAALLEQVRSKNDKMKLMIDHLRNVYRDCLTFRNNLNLYYPRNAPPAPSSKN